jgi:hypothetical protein
MQGLQSSTSHRAAGYYKRVAPESRLFAQMSSCVAVSKNSVGWLRDARECCD